MRSSPRRLVIALLLAMAGAAQAQQAPAPGPDVPPAPAPVDAAPDAPASHEGVPIEEIRRYVAVYRTIQQAYVDEVGDRELMRAAIRGLLADLDPHSAYLDAEQSRSLDESAEGAYEGIGVELVQLPDRSLRVIAPIDGSPAQRAGLRAGDVITAIDGQPIEVDGVDGAILGLRGLPGTEVRLTVVRDGDAAPRELVVVREVIRIASARGHLLEPGYGYLRIATFQGNTGLEVARLVREFKAASGGHLRGLVLDLRSNPGGLLTAAVEAADTFLEEGLIVSTRGRLGFSDGEFNATPGDLLDGAPIIVLQDAGSASASEVLAGALRDHGRARVMGARSFGKGSVQTVLPLDNGDAIKLTTARYYTPSGRSIQGAGIAPDIVLDPAGEGAARGLRESDLPGHLRGDEEVDDGQYAIGVVLEGDGPIDAALAALKAGDAGAAEAVMPADAATPAAD
jgi:carboxyl-terminal processing protease